MNILKSRHRSLTAEQLHAEHGDRRRAARSRANTELRDPMSTVLLRSMH